MRTVTYSMGCSLDGYIVGPDGGFEWTAPSDELFRFALDQVRELDAHLMGRRLYETMLYWETAADDPNLDDLRREWVDVWNPLPKVVFSDTLSSVKGNARLASGSVAEEIARLRDEPGEGGIAIGGAGLAAAVAEAGLIDEYRPRSTRCWSAAASRSSRRSPARWTSSWSRPAPSMTWVSCISASA